MTWGSPDNFYSYCQATANEQVEHILSCPGCLWCDRVMEYFTGCELCDLVGLTSEMNHEDRPYGPVIVCDLCSEVVESETAS